MAGLRFVDQRGRSVGAAELQHRPVLLHFVYTACSTTCPLQVQELRMLRQQLPAPVRERLVFVSMSVNPLQDTVAALKDYARRQGADQPGWHFLTGRPEQVFTFLDRMQALAPRDPRPESHRTSLYLYDAQGALVQRYAGTPIDQARLVAEITQVTQASPNP